MTRAWHMRWYEKKGLPILATRGSLRCRWSAFACAGHCAAHKKRHIKWEKCQCFWCQKHLNVSAKSACFAPYKHADQIQAEHETLLFLCRAHVVTEHKAQEARDADLDTGFVCDLEPLNKALAEQAGLEVVEADLLDIRPAASEGVSCKWCQNGAPNDLLDSICSRVHAVCLAATATLLLGLTCSPRMCICVWLQSARSASIELVGLYVSQSTIRFESTAKVLAECKLNYQISECRAWPWCPWQTLPKQPVSRTTTCTQRERTWQHCLLASATQHWGAGLTLPWTQRNHRLEGSASQWVDCGCKLSPAWSTSMYASASCKSDYRGIMMRPQERLMPWQNVSWHPSDLDVWLRPCLKCYSTNQQVKWQRQCPFARQGSTNVSEPRIWDGNRS